MIDKAQLVSRINSELRSIPDFPSPGIIFKDITPLIKDKETFALIIKYFAEKYADANIDYIVGVDARGFIFGAALAYELGIGFVPVRKAGKLPYKKIATSYELEYGTATVEMHEDALDSGDKIVLIDDLLATGGSLAAAVELLEQLKADIFAIETIVELGFLDGRKKLEGYDVNSLVIE
ncbi:adenine phosphoribosyltransferase [Lentisphaerota bacterium WC36G]|nr:adenine phosphoribosyltransferase [Lentisphaerae bacterium WC36]